MVKRPRLLIGDDDADIVRMLRSLLEQDYDVVTADNGVAGL